MMEKKANVPQKVADVFRRLLAASMKLMYATPEATKGIVKVVRGAQNPVDGILVATGMVLKQLRQHAKNVPTPIMERLALPVASLVAEIAIAAGAIQDDKKLMQQLAAGIQKAKAAPTRQQHPVQQRRSPPPGLVANAMEA